MPGPSPLVLWVCVAAAEAWLGVLFLRHGWQPWTLAGLSGNLTVGLLHGLSTGAILWAGGGIPYRWLRACLLGWGGVSVLNGALTHLLPLSRDAGTTVGEFAVRAVLSGGLLGLTQSRALRGGIGPALARRWIGVAALGSLVSWSGLGLTLLIPWGTLPPLLVLGLDSSLQLGSGLLGGLITCRLCGYWPTSGAVTRPGVLRALRTAPLAPRFGRLLGGCLLAGLLVGAGWPPTTLLGAGGAVRSVAVAADGGTWASLAEDGRVRLWRRTDRHLQAVWELAAGPVAQGGVAFAPDGRLVAAGADAGTIQVWEQPSGRRLRPLQAAAAVVGLTFTPDSSRLLVATASGVVHCWRVADGSLLWTRDSGIGPLHSLTLAPAGDTFAVGGQHGAVSVGPVALDSEIQPLRPPGGQPLFPDAAPETTVAYTSEGRTLVAGAYNYEFTGGTLGTHLRVPLGTLTVWSLGAVPASRQIDLPALGSWDLLGLFFGERRLAALAVAPARPIAAVSIGIDVWLWQWDSSAYVTTLLGATADVTSLAFTPDGQILLGGSQDGQVQLWDVRSY